LRVKMRRNTSRKKARAFFTHKEVINKNVAKLKLLNSPK
jgi:hypothetical protein